MIWRVCTGLSILISLPVLCFAQQASESFLLDLLQRIPVESRIEARLLNGDKVQGLLIEVTDHDLAMTLHEKKGGHSAHQTVERIPLEQVESIVNLDQLAEAVRPVDLGADAARLAQEVTFPGSGSESAAAQPLQKGPGGVRRNKGRQYYVFAGPGTFGSESATYTIGGGGEWFLNRNAEGPSKGLALGIEGSILGYPECGVCGGYLLGAFNASYHFGGRKLAPFVTGGVGGASSTEGGGVGLMNVGAGVTYWFGRYGLRLEVRDHVDFDFSAHNVSLRIGFTF
jgi:hypothetical protein